MCMISHSVNIWVILPGVIESTYCVNCYTCHNCEDCTNCNKCNDCNDYKDCVVCNDCDNCDNLVGKKNWINNEPIKK